MTPNPSDDRGASQRSVPTVVDLTGMHRKALESLADELLPYETVQVLQSSSQIGRSKRLRGQLEKDPFKAPHAIPIAPPFETAAAAADSLRALIAKANTPAPPAAAAARVTAPSPAQELHHLAELRDLGVISEDEFAIMKARIVHGG